MDDSAPTALSASVAASNRASASAAFDARPTPSEAQVRSTCRLVVSTAARAFYTDECVAVVDILLREGYILEPRTSAATASSAATSLLPRRRLRSILEYLRSEGFVECEDATLPPLATSAKTEAAGGGRGRGRSRRAKRKGRKVRAWYVDYDRALDTLRLRLHLTERRLAEAARRLRSSADLVCPFYFKNECNGRYSEEDASSYLLFDADVGAFLCGECRERFEERRDGGDPTPVPSRSAYALRHEDNSERIREVEDAARRLRVQMSARDGMRRGLYDLIAEARRAQKERGGLPSTLPSEIIAREAAGGEAPSGLDVAAEESALAHELAGLGLGQSRREEWEDAAKRVLVARQRPPPSSSEMDDASETKEGGRGDGHDSEAHPSSAQDASVLRSENLPWFLRDSPDRPHSISNDNGARTGVIGRVPPSRGTTGESILTHLTADDEQLLDEADLRRVFRIELDRMNRQLPITEEDRDGKMEASNNDPNISSGSNHGSRERISSSHSEPSYDDIDSDEWSDGDSSGSSDSTDGNIGDNDVKSSSTPEEIRGEDTAGASLNLPLRPQHPQSQLPAPLPAMMPRARDFSSSSANPAERKKGRIRTSESIEEGSVPAVSAALPPSDQILAYFQHAPASAAVAIVPQSSSTPATGTSADSRITTGEFMDDFHRTWGGAGASVAAQPRLTSSSSPEESGPKVSRSNDGIGADASADSATPPSAPVGSNNHVAPLSSTPAEASAAGGGGSIGGGGRMTTGEALEHFSCMWAPTSPRVASDQKGTDSISEGRQPAEAAETAVSSTALEVDEAGASEAGRITTGDIMEDFMEKHLGTRAAIDSGGNVTGNNTVLASLLADVEKEISQEEEQGLRPPPSADPGAVAVAETRTGEGRHVRSDDGAIVGDGNSGYSARSRSAFGYDDGNLDGEITASVAAVNAGQSGATDNAPPPPADLPVGPEAGTSSDAYRNEDVLCVRGGASIHHPGNKWYHERAATFKPEYLREDTPYRRKIELRDALIRAVHERGGRFVHKDGSGSWVELPPHRIKKKVSQHLRERKA